MDGNLSFRPARAHQKLALAVAFPKDDQLARLAHDRAAAHVRHDEVQRPQGDWSDDRGGQTR